MHPTLVVRRAGQGFIDQAVELRIAQRRPPIALGKFRRRHVGEAALGLQAVGVERVAGGLQAVGAGAAGEDQRGGEGSKHVKQPAARASVET
ncbi:hypothetical protein AB4084_11975 [Lysobacter sp. 2RAB21]